MGSTHQDIIRSIRELETNWASVPREIVCSAQHIQFEHYDHQAAVISGERYCQMTNSGPTDTQGTQLSSSRPMSCGDPHGIFRDHTSTSGISVIHDGDDNYTPSSTATGRRCNNCKTQNTTMWRWGGENNGYILCNPCGLHWRRKGLHKPLPVNSRAPIRRRKRKRTRKVKTNVTSECGARAVKVPKTGGASFDHNTTSACNVSLDRLQGVPSSLQSTRHKSHSQSLNQRQQHQQLQPEFEPVNPCIGSKVQPPLLSMQVTFDVADIADIARRIKCRLQQKHDPNLEQLLMWLTVLSNGQDISRQLLLHLDG